MNNLKKSATTPKPSTRKPERGSYRNYLISYLKYAKGATPEEKLRHLKAMTEE